MKNRRLELAKRNIENIYIYFISHIIKILQESYTRWLLKKSRFIQIDKYLLNNYIWKKLTFLYMCIVLCVSRGCNL